MAKGKVKYIIIPSVLLITVIAMISFYLTVSTSYKKSVKSINSVKKKLDVFYRNPAKAPSEMQLKQIKEYQEELKVLKKQSIYTYKSMAEHEPAMKLIEFKERLTELDENYSKFNIPIPKGVGFREYQGFSVPSASEMEIISRQLSFVTQILDLLISNNVEAVNEVRRLNVENVKLPGKGKEHFNAYNFIFTFTIGTANLLSFWDSVITSPFVIKLKKLEVESGFAQTTARTQDPIDRKMIRVEMQLCLMEFVE